MLWKIYTWIFTLINAISLIAFDYSTSQLIPIFSLILSIGLNIAVFSYAYQKPLLPKTVLKWLFRLNVGLIGIFLVFELVTFLQEAVGSVGISLPTSGVISIIASFPSLPALYATYKLAYKKISKSKKKKG